MKQKWIRGVSSNGQLGKAPWKKLEDTSYDEKAWQICKETGFLPVAEQEEKPNDNSFR